MKVEGQEKLAVQFQRLEKQCKQSGDQPAESECGNAQENMETRSDWRQFTENQFYLSLLVDTYFHNGLDSYLHAITRPNKLLRLSENGDITYSIRLFLFFMQLLIFIFRFRLTVKAKCPMTLNNFPMDQQTCPLIFGSCESQNFIASAVAALLIQLVLTNKQSH